jgi:hypothetical protein
MLRLPRPYDGTRQKAFMTEIKFKIALAARSQSRLFMAALARDLKVRFGAELHLYCFGSQELSHYQNLNKDGLFTTISDSNIVLRRCFDTDLDEAAVINRAQEMERRLGVTINRLIVPDRHFGRGYSLAGYYHPRSRYSECTSYLQAVHAYCESLDFWQEEFQSKGINLCIDGSREAFHMARCMDIPYRVLIGSRFQNYNNWAHNDHYENPKFEERWHELKDSDGLEMESPYLAHQANRKRSLNQVKLTRTVKNIILTTLRYGYWHLRGYEKARGYYFWGTIQFHIRLWAAHRHMRRLAKTKLPDLAGKRFVYYPLHVEPETALHGLSPEYFYQHALIAAVSRDLPAGVYLAVKEAYGSLGRRPANFYRQVADLKNVVWVDVWERGFDCARQANAVVTICGTAGLEAVTSGTPVIAFGRHNIYNFLPSVQVVEDETMLAGYLRNALCRNDAERVSAEGKRLLRAIVDESFDMGKFDYIHLDQFENDTVRQATDALIKSLPVAPQPKQAEVQVSA